MLRPLLSVVVPAFNAENTLKKTLLSVAAQMETYPNCEVIIIDDGSTDGTSRIILQFEQWDERFKSLKRENRGVSAARNKGVEIAGGDYIAFLDADDLFLKESISERMRVLLEEDDPNMLGVFCPAVFIDSSGNILRTTRQFDYHLSGDRLYFSFMPESVFNPSCVIVKKGEFIKTGGFDESITPAEDYDLWHRMMRGGGYFRKVGSCSIGWRQHTMSASHSKILRHYNQCKIVTERVFAGSPHSSPEEYQGGFGKSLYYSTITSRAFGSSILAVVAGQYDDAIEISADIKKSMINQILPERLEEMIKFSALRALSRSEDEWQTLVWPEVQKDVLNFICELNQKLGGDCNSLLTLINRLEREDIKSYG
jgi:glycosyltransferase involved in cell wall biosynthesis